MIRIAAIIVPLALVCGLIGFVIGRSHPAHHYVPYQSTFLLDTSTGRVCDSLPPNPYRDIMNKTQPLFPYCAN